MKTYHNDPNAIPCMVLTFTEDELAIVNDVLEKSGYDDDLKSWILDRMSPEEAEEDSRYAGAADRVIHNVSDFVKENPDTIRAGVSLAGNLLNRMIKKGPLQ